MKRIFGVLLCALLLLSLFSVTAFAAEENDIGEFELPSPKAPNYFVYTDGNATEGHHDHLRMIMVADPEGHFLRQSTTVTARPFTRNTVFIHLTS